MFWQFPQFWTVNTSNLLQISGKSATIKSIINLEESCLYSPATKEFAIPANKYDEMVFFFCLQEFILSYSGPFGFNEIGKIRCHVEAETGNKIFRSYCIKEMS